MEMIRQRDIFNCLPLLASALGNRYGVKVRMGGRRAFSSGKMIQLPALPLEPDRTVMALVKGYLDHEAAHIRYTDFVCFRKAASNPLLKFLCNSLEDWRVEKRLGELYPGCKANLAWLAKHFFLAGTDEAGFNPASSVLNYILLSARSWEVEELAETVTEMKYKLASVCPGLTDSIDRILTQVRKVCPDTRAVSSYALALAEIIKNYAAKQVASCHSLPVARTMARPHNPGASKEELLRQPGWASMIKGTEFRALDEVGAPTVQTLGELPKCMGERIAETLAEISCKNFEHSVEVANCVEATLRKMSTSEIQAAIQSSNTMRQRLAALLQAQELRQIAHTRKGRLDTARVHRVLTNSAQVFLKEEPRERMCTAVHILLDASRSMAQGPLNVATQACFAAAKALGSIKGLNPAVTVFPADVNGGVYPLLRHGQKLTTRCVLNATGSTPLAPALWYVAQILSSLPERRKIILLITDGIPDNQQATMEVIRAIRKLGMEIYGLGIFLEKIKELLPGKSRTIHSLDQLTPALFAMLRETLIRKGKH